jgi:hypothetical protein
MSSGIMAARSPKLSIFPRSSTNILVITTGRGGVPHKENDFEGARSNRQVTLAEKT